jgi:hypothetical protein
MRTLHDPFVAIAAGTDLRAHARALRRTWEATVRGQAPPIGARPVIAQSWARVARRRGEPGALHPRRALDARDVDEVRRASPLREVLPVLRHHLGSMADDAEHVMVLCDDTGCILWIEGHPSVRHRADGIAFAEGMLWTEDSAGTNAIGTALAIDHAVQVFAAEHFLPEQHAWWCSAAPIHDPSGRVLGVVDISGPLATAHPHSLALVMAAAERAEDVLRLAHSGRGAAADRGRVLSAEQTGWRRAVDPPPESGSVTLHLELLGRHRPIARLGAGRPVELSLRHAEVLALLALHPEGLSAEQLTLHLYGESGNRISTRAEMSRLRKLLGSAIAAKPYRLVARVEADFLEVERRLGAGGTAEALRDYHGPLLLESECARVRQARDELEGALRRAALAGSLAELGAWLETASGRDDPAAIEAYLERATHADPRRPLLAARLHLLLERWQLPEAPAARRLTA